MRVFHSVVIREKPLSKRPRIQSRFCYLFQMDSFKSRGDTVLFVLLLLTGQLCVIVQCCSSHGHVNGCSIPFDWPYFYKSHFKPDCNKHDICYACVGHKHLITCQVVSLFGLIKQYLFTRRYNSYSISV